MAADVEGGEGRGPGEGEEVSGVCVVVGVDDVERGEGAGAPDLESGRSEGISGRRGTGRRTRTVLSPKQAGGVSRWRGREGRAGRTGCAEEPAPVLGVLEGEDAACVSAEGGLEGESGAGPYLGTSDERSGCGCGGRATGGVDGLRCAGSGCRSICVRRPWRC